MRKLLTLALLALGFASLGQGVEAEWEIGFEEDSAKVGDTVTLVVYATPPPGWKLYSTRAEGCDFSPMMASITFKHDSSFKLIDSLEAVGEKRKYDEDFECHLWYFPEEALFKQKIKVLQKDLKVVGVYDGQMCNDSVCIMLMPDDFVFKGLVIE